MAEPPTIISCNAPYASGGLGQHFSDLVEQTRLRGELLAYYSARIKQGDERIGHVVRDSIAPLLFRFTPIRFSPARKAFLSVDRFDKLVAKRLKGPFDCFIGFGAQSLATFKRARLLGCQKLCVMAGSTHVNNVWRRHRAAEAQYKIEPSWMNQAYRTKALREYEMADEILVASEHSRQSFLTEGIPERKLRRIIFKVDPRFVPPLRREDDGIFRVVYTGSVTVSKGVPVLLEAFSRFNRKDARLTIVGNTSTSSMRKYMEAWIKRDARMHLAPGDPLPHLQQADVYVHPSFEDGLAYAPLEAMACGVPVIVTEDTGMKEYVREGETGYVVPTGSWEAILNRMEAIANPNRAPTVAPASIS